MESNGGGIHPAIHYEQQSCCNHACMRTRRGLATVICSPLGVIVIIMGYVTMGAFVFNMIEGENENEHVFKVTTMRHETIDRMWDITMTLNILYKENWTHMVSSEMYSFQQHLVEAIEDGYEGKELRNGRHQWSISGAFLYSLTVITTIGN